MSPKDEKKNVDEVTDCPDCGSNHLKRDYDHAEIVCADCGLVLEENIVDTGPEWRAFGYLERCDRWLLSAQETNLISRI